MRLEYYLQSKLEAEIKSIVAKYIDLADVDLFFFGSRVTDGGNDRSDIDIGILRRDGQSIELKIYGQIKDELDEVPTLYTLDFVDFALVGEDFKEVALSNVEYIK